MKAKENGAAALGTQTCVRIVGALLLIAVVSPSISNAQLVELRSWWRADGVDDNALSSDPSFGDANPGYTGHRWEGRVFSPSGPRPLDTVGLYTWYSPSRDDYFTTSNPAWIPAPGVNPAPVGAAVSQQT